MALSQTRESVLKDWSKFTHSSTAAPQKSSEFTMRGQYAGTVLVDYLPLETTAPTVPVQFQVQAASMDLDDWTVVGNAVRSVSTAAAGVSQIAAAGEAIGQTELSVKADPTAVMTPGTAVGLVRLASSLAELGTVARSATGGTHEVHVLDAITNALVENDLIVPAVLFEIPIQLGLYPRLRVVALGDNHASTGPDYLWRARIRGWFLT